MSSCFRFQSLFHCIGHLHLDLSLRALYSAADEMVVFSRQEAHACGTPLVAFRTGGLPDIFEHNAPAT